MGIRTTLVLVAMVFAGHAQQMKITYDQPLPVVQNGKFGYIDHQGSFVIKPQFHWASSFQDGFAEAYVCGREVSIDRTGKIQPHRIPLDGAESVPYRKDNKVGFAVSSGQFKIPPTFDEALPFSDGMAAVKVGEKWGFIDTAGHMVITPRFEDAYYFVEGVAAAELGERSVLINRQGKVVASGFDSDFAIAEGRVLVSRGRLSGFIDFSGKVVVPLVYEGAVEYNGGLAAVSKAGKWGYIDRDGRVKIPFKFDEVGSFYGKLAAAKRGDQTGFIDRSGKFVFLLPYRHSAGFTDGDVARFWTDDRRFGWVHESGKVIWGPNAEDPFEELVLVNGWSDEDKRKSCEGFPESIRTLVASFPPTDE